MQITLTKEQLQIIFQMTKQINWPGEMLEKGVELKKILAEALEKSEEKPKEEPK